MKKCGDETFVVALSSYGCALHIHPVALLQSATITDLHGKALKVRAT
jgi:hypothetical protein